MEQNYLDPGFLELVRQGNDNAFRVLMKRHQRPLFAFANRFLSNKEDAEDAVAEGFARLASERQVMESISNIEGFLYTTVRNLCLNALRNKRSTRRLLEIRPSWLQRSEKAGPEMGSDQKLLLADLSYWLNLSLQDMPEPRRLAYQLRVLEKMPMADVCDRLGLSERTIREYVNAAQKQIYGYLINKGIIMCLIIWLLAVFYKRT